MNLVHNRIVVKVGTSTLTNEKGNIDLKAFERLAFVLSDLHNQGYQVILVTSGAIAVGYSRLGFEKRPTSIRMLQASAAVGQNRLMSYYNKFFSEFDKTIAQILLSAEDMTHEEKTKNLINTFEALLEQNIIPVVNENDSVSFTEIESEDQIFGDNDMLSAIVAVLTKAENLIIFSDIDGFYDKDPRFYTDAQLISEVKEIDHEILEKAGGAGSNRGTGGMRTKLQAATLANRQGINTIITNGKKPDNIYPILEGKKIGTKFVGHKY